MKNLITIFTLGLAVSTVVAATPVNDIQAQRALTNLISNQAKFGLYGEVTKDETLASVIAALLAPGTKSLKNSCDLDLTHDWPILFCKVSADAIGSSSQAGSLEIDYSFNITLVNGKIGDLSPTDANVFHATH